MIKVLSICRGKGRSGKVTYHTSLIGEFESVSPNFLDLLLQVRGPDFGVPRKRLLLVKVLEGLLVVKLHFGGRRVVVHLNLDVLDFTEVGHLLELAHEWAWINRVGAASEKIGGDGKEITRNIALD